MCSSGVNIYDRVKHSLRFSVATSLFVTVTITNCLLAWDLPAYLFCIHVCAFIT